MIIFCSFDKKTRINNKGETRVKEKKATTKQRKRIKATNLFLWTRFAISMEIKAHDKDFM